MGQVVTGVQLIHCKITKSLQGTILNCASFAIHGDDRYWERPQEFWPERWLDSNGKINMKKEGFVPFGVGKLA